MRSVVAVRVSHELQRRLGRATVGRLTPMAKRARSGATRSTRRQTGVDWLECGLVVLFLRSDGRAGGRHLHARLFGVDGAQEQAGERYDRTLRVGEESRCQGVRRLTYWLASLGVKAWPNMARKMSPALSRPM